MPVSTFCGGAAKRCLDSCRWKSEVKCESVSWLRYLSGLAAVTVCSSWRRSLPLHPALPQRWRMLLDPGGNKGRI